MVYVLALTSAAVIILAWKVLVLTIVVKKLTEHHAKLIVATSESFGEIDKRFDKVNNKFDNVNARFREVLDGKTV